MNNPWQALSQHPPFVLDSDRPYIDLFNQRAKPEVQIHLEALPEPFLGNPTAPVVLLNLNPGFGEETLPFHQDNAYFRESHSRNLLHVPAEYPFYLLDPNNKDSPGYHWWRQYLRSLVETLGQQKVANNILCVEYFPYASRKFGFGSILASQQYSFHLVREAMKRNAVIIRMRGERFWFSAVPELQEYNQFFRLKNVQRVYVTHNNCPSGYASIISRIRNGN